VEGVQRDRKRVGVLRVAVDELQTIRLGVFLKKYAYAPFLRDQSFSMRVVWVVWTDYASGL
jgi:hypothetical protein